MKAGGIFNPLRQICNKYLISDNFEARFNLSGYLTWLAVPTTLSDIPAAVETLTVIFLDARLTIEQTDHTFTLRWPKHPNTSVITVTEFECAQLWKVSRYTNEVHT